MQAVSKWEIAGVPAAVAFEAAYALKVFDGLGITAEQLPHLMVLSFIAVASLRAYLARRAGKSKDGSTEP